MDWKIFQRYFCDPDANDCHNRIATLLSYTMMRRTMKTTILNRAIITLPPPHPEIRYVQFSAEERIIYRIVSTFSVPFQQVNAKACVFLLFYITQTNWTIPDRKPIPHKPKPIFRRGHSLQSIPRLPRPTSPSTPMHFAPFHARAHYQRMLDHRGCQGTAQTSQCSRQIKPALL
jgi:hypothetical protein